MKIDSAQATVLNKRILPPDTREVKLRASGTGIGLVQVGYEFNVDVVGASEEAGARLHRRPRDRSPVFPVAFDQRQPDADAF